MFQDTLVKSVLKQHQQPFGVNILVAKPGSTFFSRVFNYVSCVLNFKRFDYPMVTEAVSFAFTNRYRILDKIALLLLSSFSICCRS